MPLERVDLNADVGEGVGQDPELIPLVTSVNIACGGHAGDAASMRAADPTFETMLKAAGASVINIPSTEIYPSLQSGVLTSTLTSAETFVSMRIYEQTKFATVGGDYTLWWLMQPLVMSKAAWDRLTPAQQKIFEEAADVSNKWFADSQREAVTRMIEAYKKAGAQVAPLSKKDFDAWIALAKKTSWPEFSSKSPEAKQLLELLTSIK